MKNKITFPHLGKYYIPISYVIKKITHCEIIIPSINNQETIKKGSIYSPNEVCMPFKYNLGNYIDALEKGATIIIQAGGGCRYGYFGELQAELLENLGYNFRFVNLIKNDHISLIKLYNFAKEINPHLHPIAYIYYLLQGILMIIYIDKLDQYQRINMGKSANKERFNYYNRQILKYYSQEKLSIYKIIKRYYYFKKKYLSIPIKEENNISILIIGELYTLMDSTANNNLEERLINENITIYRYTNLTYLLLQKRFVQNKILRKTHKYLKYHLGADGTESVYHALNHCQKGIDGIIHIKSYGCVPEINAIPALNSISGEYHVPILYLSFDSENNIANLETKLEAFIDMLKERHNF